MSNYIIIVYVFGEMHELNIILCLHFKNYSYDRNVI